MTNKIRWAYVFFFTVFASSCSIQPVRRPVTDLTKRYIGYGYSVLPPQGKDWYIVDNSLYSTVFHKSFPEKMDKLHTFIASAMVKNLEAKQVNSSTEFPKAIERYIVEYIATGQFLFISVEVDPYGPTGSYCSQFELVEEEKGNPSAPGVILEITVYGFICLDASSEFMTMALYGERKPRGSQSFINPTLKREGEGFLKNVQVTPYMDKIQPLNFNE